MPKQLKGEINYKIKLTEEQKNVKAGAYEKDVSIVLGDYGSGKTQVAALIALDMLFKKSINKIYITRPIEFKATGYLTGTAADKMYFHTFPLKQNFLSAYDPIKINKLFEEKTIEIIPIDYLKGYTISNAIMIIDEFEDISFDDFKLILSRLGKDSKMIFTGSEEQIGVKNSCIKKVKLLKTCPFVNFHTLTSQHRNSAISNILEYIQKQELAYEPETKSM